MTNYTFPTSIGPARITIRQVQNVERQESPFSFAEQVIGLGGQKWEADISLPEMDNDQARPWIAWLSKLKGGLHSFTMGDPAAATPLGSAGGTPLVNGASQTGGALVLDGAATSQTGWLKAGDMIQLGTGEDARLHMVTDDANSDGSGNVTLNIWPDLNSPPADNAAIVVTGAVGAWRLRENTLSYGIDEDTIYNIQFSATGIVG